MTIKRLHFVIDKAKKSKTYSRKILYRYRNFSPNLCEIIVVVGGDGFMLQTLKKYKKYKKPFYGINKGTFGFLMNKYKNDDILKNISKSREVSISPLEVQATTKKNKILSCIAINEVSLLRQSRQTASLRIENNKKILIKRLISDGVLVSTPAGSTAYNLSVHGPILSLDSKKIAITPISPFRPRRWKGKILSSSSIIKIINLNIQKRPISAVADNIEVRNIKNLKIKINNKIKFKLLFDGNNSLSKKIKLEQIRKQIN